MLLEWRTFYADNYDDQEAIIKWYYDETEENSLLIVDQYNMIERYKEISSDYSYSITWLTPSSNPEPNKQCIFISTTFDETAKNYMIEYGGIIGFFN
jgi:hypothetical protein